eukprot:6207470-Pleurochrysis_carterae.AAC.1
MSTGATRIDALARPSKKAPDAESSELDWKDFSFNESECAGETRRFSEGEKSVRRMAVSCDCRQESRGKGLTEQPARLEGVIIVS